MHDTDTPASADGGAFCRAVEAHLCRVNGGHLVRIVGPAFELVAGWARDGMPLRVVLHGVDRTVTRLTAKGPRRRPVRVEFCDADVRDAFDQWRRAVGVHAATGATSTAAQSGEPAVSAASARMPSLPKHLERVLVRLSSILATHALPADLAAALARTLRDVDACLDASRGARGDARGALVERLTQIEDAMTAAALDSLDPAGRASIDEEVRRELAAYRGQMPSDALREAEQALRGELARRHFTLPQVRLHG